MNKNQIRQAYESINASSSFKERLKASCKQGQIRLTDPRKGKFGWKKAVPVIAAAAVIAVFMASRTLYHEDEELTLRTSDVTTVTAVTNVTDASEQEENFTYNESGEEESNAAESANEESAVSKNTDETSSYSHEYYVNAETAKSDSTKERTVSINVVDSEGNFIPNLQVVILSADKLSADNAEYDSRAIDCIAATDGSAFTREMDTGEYIFRIYDRPANCTTTYYPGDDFPEGAVPEISEFRQTDTHARNSAEYSVTVDENTEEITLVWEYPTPAELNKSDDSAFAITLNDKNGKPLEGYYVILTPLTGTVSYQYPDGYSGDFGGYVLSLTDENGRAYWANPIKGCYTFTAYKDELSSIDDSHENMFTFPYDVIITVDEDSGGDEMIFRMSDESEPSFDKLLQKARDNTYCFPLKDVPSKVSAEFDAGSPGHKGIDVVTSGGLDDVSASLDGIVTWAGYSDEQPGYGIFVEIYHANGLYTIYAHLSEVSVSRYDRVQKGQAIGKVGMTGYATGQCLHFEMVLDGQDVDPEDFDFEGRKEIEE
jgi:hypothetical protein